MAGARAGETSDEAHRIAIVVDADASIPERLRDDLGILTAPADAPMLLEPETIPALRLEAVEPLDAELVASVCGNVARDASALLYVTTGDDFGSPDGAAKAARRAAVAKRPDIEFAAHESGAALMGCGWQAVEAATIVRRGGTLTDAAEAASGLRDRVSVLALLEHPELASAAGMTVLGLFRGRRAIVELRGAELVVLSRPARRDEALVELRDRFAERARAGAGPLRVAVHHAAAAPAAEAMSRWVERDLAPQEVVIAPITRHAATRLGPEMVGFAWYHAP
jgi:fatty acid-binding protein DegV